MTSSKNTEGEGLLQADLAVLADEIEGWEDMARQCSTEETRRGCLASAEALQRLEKRLRGLSKSAEWSPTRSAMFLEEAEAVRHAQHLPAVVSLVWKDRGKQKASSVSNDLGGFWHQARGCGVIYDVHSFDGGQTFVCPACSNDDYKTADAAKVAAQLDFETCIRSYLEPSPQRIYDRLSSAALPSEAGQPAQAKEKGAPGRDVAKPNRWSCAQCKDIGAEADGLPPTKEDGRSLDCPACGGDWYENEDGDFDDIGAEVQP